jgi:hypothetical protein
MARTTVERSITFDCYSRLTNFLGVGYSTKGVALATLKKLSPMFPSPSIPQLSELKPRISPRTQRADDPDVDSHELAFLVVMFKKITNKNLPPSLSM